MRDHGGVLVLTEAMDCASSQICCPRTDIRDVCRKGLAPPARVGRLGAVKFDDEKTLEIDSESMISTFNLCRLPAAWRGMLAYSSFVPASVPQTEISIPWSTLPSRLCPWSGLERWIWSSTWRDASHVRWPAYHLSRHDGAHPGLCSRFLPACDVLGPPLQAGTRITTLLEAQVDGQKGILRHGWNERVKCYHENHYAVLRTNHTSPPCGGCMLLRRPLNAIFEEVGKQYT